MPKAISKERVQKMLSDGIKIIDIRTTEEYEKLHIPEVMHIPFENFGKELPIFDEEDVLVCVCNHGKERSQEAAEFLLNAGFKNTFYLQGGTSGWYE